MGTVPVITEAQAKQLLALKNVCVETALQYKRSQEQFTSYGRRGAAKARRKKAQSDFANYVAQLSVEQ